MASRDINSRERLRDRLQSLTFSATHIDENGRFCVLLALLLQPAEVVKARDGEQLLERVHALHKISHALRLARDDIPVVGSFLVIAESVRVHEHVLRLFQAVFGEVAWPHHIRKHCFIEPVK
jgi:hypothetical protein